MTIFRKYDLVGEWMIQIHNHLKKEFDTEFKKCTLTKEEFWHLYSDLDYWRFHPEDWRKYLNETYKVIRFILVKKIGWFSRKRSEVN